MSEQPRPVWLTREQRDFLDRRSGDPGSGWCKPIADAWDAAPADAVEAALTAHRDALASNTDLPVSAVLRALGIPDA